MAAVFAAVIIITGTTTVSAHRSGCHAWHSCPSDHGTYVCGDTGHSNYCGGSPSSAETTYQPPAPRVPVVTKESTATDEAIPFGATTEKTTNEYTDYSKIIRQGTAGLKRNYYEVTLTDGNETSRKFVRTEIVSNPTPEVTSVGARKKPTATLSTVKRTHKKQTYDITGIASPNTQVVLSVDGKKVKRANVSKDGSFVFKNIKLSATNPKISVFNRIKGKETLISEGVTVNLSKNTLSTDYQALHKTH